MSEPTCTCGGTIKPLDGAWSTCDACNACYPNRPTRADRRADLGYDAISESYGPGDMTDGHWQARQRAKYGRDYNEPRLDEGEG